MKKLILLSTVAILTLAMFSCRKKGEISAVAKLQAEVLKDTTYVVFIDSPTYYFDTIMQGDKVQTNFRLVNTGEKNLIIASAIGSCGCTVPEYPKEPVKPGDTATIQVTFNSAGKELDQTKTVTLVCNTEKRNEMLYLKGFVTPKE